MLRQPPSAELFHAPPEFLCALDGTEVVALPLGASVRAAALREFVRRLRAQGHAVQPARLGYDRLYAFDCFSLAHACDDAALRALALELFAAFERRAA